MKTLNNFSLFNQALSGGALPEDIVDGPISDSSDSDIIWQDDINMQEPPEE